METREITVVSNKTQKKTTIKSAAETLGELKKDLEAAGINVTDMTFYEGHTRAEYKDDNAILPTNVNHKGTITNNLAFLLSQPDKKISSGSLSRPECYAFIKEYNLKDKIQAAFNKNFTVCKTSALVDFIESFKNQNSPKIKVESSVKMENLKEDEPEVKPKTSINLLKTKKPASIGELVIEIETLVNKLINTIEDKGIINAPKSDSYEPDDWNDSDESTNYSEEKGYSQDDLNEMFGL